MVDRPSAARHPPRSSADRGRGRRRRQPSRGVHDALIAGRAASCRALGESALGGEVPVAVQEVPVDGRQPRLAARGDGGDVQHRRARQLGRPAARRVSRRGAVMIERQVLRRPREAASSRACSAVELVRCLAHARDACHVRTDNAADARSHAVPSTIRSTRSLRALAGGVGLLGRHPVVQPATAHRPRRRARAPARAAPRAAPRTQTVRSHGTPASRAGARHALDDEQPAGRCRATRRRPVAGPSSSTW